MPRAFDAALIPSEIGMIVMMSDLSVSALAFAISAGQSDHSEAIVSCKGEPGATDHRYLTNA